MEIPSERTSLSFEDRLDRPKGRRVRGKSAGARFTEEELKEMDTAANRDGKLFAEWARDVLLREARAPRADALFTEIVAMRIFLNNVLRSLVCGGEMSGESFSALLSQVRVEKRKAAADLMQQYTITEQKER